jgi:hypothetical protein
MNPLTHNAGRRLFLKAVAGLWAAKVFDNFLVPHWILNQAQAQSDWLNTYVQFNLFGAPSRWQFDLPLKPHTGDRCNRDPYIGTEIVNGESGPELIYKTMDHEGIQVSSFWNNSYINTVGQRAPFAELLSSMLTVRGVDMKVNGHFINNKRLIAPIGGGESITARIASRLKAPLPSLGYRSYLGGVEAAPDAFHSDQGLVGINIPYGTPDPLNFLFGESVANPGEETDLIVEEMLNHLSAKIKDQNGSAHKIFSERKQAQKLKGNTIDLLRQQFPPSFKKYLKLFNTNFAIPLRGNDDKPIACNKSHPLYGMAALKLERHLLTGPDLRAYSQQVDHTELATQFAFLEVMISNRLCTNFIFCLNGFSKIEFKGTTFNKTQLANGGWNFSRQSSLADAEMHVRPAVLTFDTHDYGTLPNHYFGIKFYQIFAAGLLELKSKLKTIKIDKQRSLFDTTLFHIASEFDREPNLDGSGSEHGFNGSTQSFVSGSIPRYQLIGNILSSSAKTQSIKKSASTWGHGARVNELGDRELSYGNISSSLAGIFGFANLTPNNPAVFGLVNGQIRGFNGRAKNINNG